MSKVYFCSRVIFKLCEFSKLTAVVAGYSLKYMAELVSIVLLQRFHCYTDSRSCFAVNLNSYVLACKAFYKSQHNVVTLALTANDGIYLSMTKLVTTCYFIRPFIYATTKMF